MDQDVKTRVFNVIATSMKISVTDIKLNQEIKSICPHSLDLVNLVFDFEDEFDISITDEDLQGLKTVQDIVTNIESHLAKA